ncbi:uncharacterized protein LOC134265259 [Saccostrea cucullata]|uniref:uncharacterized protein LOC134265259 n=1 Tax=Saccostrea cuccullata TaxID=36930 RepID=UPI002ED27CCE
MIVKLLISLAVISLAAILAEALIPKKPKSFGSQFLTQTLRRGARGRGRRPSGPPQCEASGHAEIVKPEDFITPHWNPEQERRVMESVRTNAEEWNRLQAFNQYYNPLDYSEYGYFKHDKHEFGCKDVCIQKRVPVLGAYLTIEDHNGMNGTYRCYVAPTQRLWYTTCGEKLPALTVKMSPSYQCLPDMIQEREVIMYCPDIVPQCRTRTFALPQTCSLQEVKCLNTMPKKFNPFLKLRG